MHLTLKNAELAYQHRIIFNQLSLDISAGQWVALLGASGVGKSSLIRGLAGLIPEFRAELSPETHLITYMSQTDMLLPWCNVLENVLMGYQLRHQWTTAVKEYALELLSRVGLAEFINFYPHQLSGGMRQRVALVRTLLENKPFVLMDEPFSAVDTLTRYKLHEIAVELLQGKTVLLVTHDPIEALRLAHVIYLMQPYPFDLKPLLNLTSPTPRPITETLTQQQVLYDYLCTP